MNKKKFSAVLLFVFAGLLIADLASLWSRQYMLPTQAPGAKPKKSTHLNNFANYQNIRSRNIFNSTGVDPDPLIATRKDKKEQELPPIPSQLPLNLMGTLVHSNPEKSLASLEIRGKNQILSYKPGQEIDTLATLQKVERMKIFVRNRSSGRLEYIEMKNMFKVPIKGATAKTESKGVVKVISETDREIKKSDLMNATKHLQDILMQARVVPARRPGTGEIYGYRLVEKQPGSIYDQLGLQIGDVLMGVNGTPVTNPQQAMEMYSALRGSANNIKIQTERDGKNIDLNYRITD